jgi:hypothetical protein
MARTATLVRRAGLALIATATVIGLAAPALAIARGTAPHGSVPGCTAAAVRAMRAGVTLTALPGDCRGLPPDQVARAAAAAISELAAHGRKTERRHLAAHYGARVSYLIRQVRPQAQAGPAPSVGPPAGPGLPARQAALVAWLLTAGTRGYLLAGWLAHGGLRRGRPARTGLPPPVIVAHFGFAVAGLIGWIGYLVSGAAPVAWLAAGLLLPVAGLGMATLVLAIPDASAGPAPAVLARGADSPQPPARARMPVLMISVHGICATVTILLVLLAAIASSGG